MKTWEIQFEVNLDASRVEIFTVKANTKRKAIIIAKIKALKKGFHNVKLISVEENYGKQ